MIVRAVTCVTLLFVASCGSAPAPAAPEAPAPTAIEAPPPVTCGPDDDLNGCRERALGEVTFGWLRGGLTTDAVVAQLGVPAERGEVWEEGASGDFVQTWTWPDAGVEVVFSAPTRDGEPLSSAYTVRAPFAGKTERGIGIGSTEADVMGAYAETIAPDSRPGELVIAGSVYGGAFFGIEDGAVVSIFVGAGAE